MQTAPLRAQQPSWQVSCLCGLAGAGLHVHSACHWQRWRLAGPAELWCWGRQRRVRWWAAVPAQCAGHTSHTPLQRLAHGPLPLRCHPRGACTQLTRHALQGCRSRPTCSTSPRAASAGAGACASRSRGPCLWSPTCCCWTSPPTTWTCMQCSGCRTISPGADGRRTCLCCPASGPLPPNAAHIAFGCRRAAAVGLRGDAAVT